MQITLRRSSRAATVLLTSLIFSGVLVITAGAMLSLSSHRIRSEIGRWQSNQAYYHAENGLNWAAQKIADASTGGTNATFLGMYSVSDWVTSQLGIPYLQSLQSEPSSGFSNAWVTIANHSSGVSNRYTVTASALVGAKVRRIQAILVKNPPSLVFDYEYFLNNWGWWWGSSITGDGDNRANWDFDFRYSPTVNGSVIANGEIASDHVPVDPLSGVTPFNGSAGSDPVGMVHSGAPRLPMPNLLDFGYYQSNAVARAGKLYVGTTLVVDAVQGNASKPGLYIKGTAADPIKVQGPVVVPGDVVISGPITGVGTLYVGGNLYVANDVTYSNGPDFSTPPTSLSPAQTDLWVQNAVSGQKDLVGFAVRGSIYGGDVNSSDFQTWCYYAGTYGLQNVGSEATLGMDGIRGTPDDNVSYGHYVGASYVTDASYDADGDGVIRAAYNLNSDILMTSGRISKILQYPTDGSGNPLSYSSIATCNYNRMDGVYYCNHATACRMAKSGGIKWNGTIICRDEAIVFNESLKFNYDPRIHSRYSSDPNRVIDLGLPVANLVRLQQIEEIAPIAGF